ncbi:MAG: helix-turn-helix transcriptional regulator, partial [Clostridia bacterium]|nr:helix-turn-helix transcriptional regulator [Clostridia bacterium]
TMPIRTNLCAKALKMEQSMEDLKMIIAGNIGKLRREAGMTQLGLAEKLNYSDKAVSKWERGESLPDVATLKELAELFSVTVDYLLRADHPSEVAAQREYTRRQRRNHRLITAMSCMLVWLVATFLFANIDLLSNTIHHHWLTFVYSVPMTAIVLLVFNCIWGNQRHNFLIISILVWSVIASVFITFLAFGHVLWLLFIIGVPAQIIIVLWSGLRLK